MKKTNALPAPCVDRPAASERKWAREQRAFSRLRPALLRTQRDRYVAIHDGKAVDSGEDEIALGLRVYTKFGYVPIYVGRVSDFFPGRWRFCPMADWWLRPPKARGAGAEQWRARFFS